MRSPIQILFDAKPWAKITEEAEPDPTRLRATLLAFTFGIIGFAMPWYSLSYAPPGGAVTIDGLTLTTFHQTYSGFSPEHAGLLTMPIGRYYFGETVISGAQFTTVLWSALLATGLATLLAVPALAPLKTPVLRVLRYNWVQLPANITHAVALMIEAIGCLSFLLLALGLGSIGAHIELQQELGNTPQAAQAASYLHIDIGSGFWLVLISFLMLVVIRAKQFFTTILMIGIGLVILGALHADGWMGPFIHSFGF